MRISNSAIASTASWRNHRGTAPECAASPADDARVTNVAANAGHDPNRFVLGDQHRTLLDMQFHPAMKVRRIDQMPRLGDRRHVDTNLRHIVREAFARQPMPAGKVVLRQQAEQRSRSKIARATIPGTFLPPQDIELERPKQRAALLRREQRHECGDDTSRAVEVPAPRHTVEMRP
jgi:hypothetical protein